MGSDIGDPLVLLEQEWGLKNIAVKFQLFRLLNFVDYWRLFTRLALSIQTKCRYYIWTLAFGQTQSSWFKISQRYWIKIFRLKNFSTGKSFSRQLRKCAQKLREDTLWSKLEFVGMKKFQKIFWTNLKKTVSGPKLKASLLEHPQKIETKFFRRNICRCRFQRVRRVFLFPNTPQRNFCLKSQLKLGRVSSGGSHPSPCDFFCPKDQCFPGIEGRINYVSDESFRLALASHVKAGIIWVERK